MGWFANMGLRLPAHDVAQGVLCVVLLDDEHTVCRNVDIVRHVITLSSIV